MSDHVVVMRGGRVMADIDRDTPHFNSEDIILPHPFVSTMGMKNVLWAWHWSLRLQVHRLHQYRH